MEPIPKKSFVLLIIGIDGAMVIMYICSLRSQLQEVRANQGNYEEQIKSLSTIQESETSKVNREFLEKFFTYEETAERYQKIMPLMTDQGYQATYPSGMELPMSDETVKSSMVGLIAFEYRSSRNEAEFFNEFKQTTQFNNIANTEM
ncbi:hypothetical protein [Bacillus sp. V5-8f]|uniref:hypothetical protein n=1 Tax=Bacillus sp. V5-8f TaxID=2053044 RepID=UPI000C7843A5|nr:hypothetical protein [Bacillus sp. V5-8f]PLT32066.1 hypothetical protein CUU64_21090 [Bacillus sp. V5-8f]